MVLTHTDLQGTLPFVGRGKVRDIYEISQDELLFVATDRISAYDVVMKNVGLSPSAIFLRSSDTPKVLFHSNKHFPLPIPTIRASPTKADCSLTSRSTGLRCSGPSASTTL